MQEAKAGLTKVPFGVKDLDMQEEDVEGFVFAYASEYTGKFDDIDLMVGEKTIKVRLGDNTYSCVK